MGKKWIGHARLLAEVPSTRIEYYEVHKISKKLDPRGSPGPWSPGSLFVPTHLKELQQRVLMKNVHT